MNLIRLISKKNHPSILRIPFPKPFLELTTMQRYSESRENKHRAWESTQSKSNSSMKQSCHYIRLLGCGIQITVYLILFLETGHGSAWTGMLGSSPLRAILSSTSLQVMWPGHGVYLFTFVWKANRSVSALIAQLIEINNRAVAFSNFGQFAWSVLWWGQSRDGHYQARQSSQPGRPKSRDLNV